MAREMTRVVPDWTSHNTHDPGITVLELLSYALTELQYRSKTIDANGRALARHVAQLADSLVGLTGTDDCPPGLQRVNYFYRPAAQRRRLYHRAGLPPGTRPTAATGCCTAPAS